MRIRNAVVTGGSRGLGRALELAVTRAGALGFHNHEFGDTLAVLPA